ncbi:MAG TPA: hypothetical protein PKD26_11725 [Pyrinomonadaceae bacterium]|nr:hypothetical protein [Pyrinomonadaceae bacterium]
MQKTHRQEAILRLVTTEPLRSQAEVAARLKQMNFAVTQASISRDLEELGIIKFDGVYLLPQRSEAAANLGLQAIDTAGDALLVVRCAPGLASAAAVRIDSERIDEIVGTIAGDDTIFIAVPDRKSQRIVMRKIWEIFET